MYFTQEPNDNALVVRARAGDTLAFEELVRRYHQVLFRVACRMLGNRDDAADAAQAAFISAFRKLDGFDGQYRFFSWLYRILVNECLNSRRSRRPHEALTPAIAGGHDPLEAFEAGERRRRVQQALLSLPHEFREVIVLRHFGDLSYDEIAATLELPAKTVKSRIYSARQRLKQLLGGE